MPRREASPPRGIVRTSGPLLRHERFVPEVELAKWLRHVWLVAWDLPTPHTQETLPHPAAHLVLERDGSRIVAVVRGRFARELAGRGMVVGLALRPGLLPCFTGEPAWRSCGRMDPLSTLWPDVGALERDVFDAESDEERVLIAERWLRARLPAMHPDAERVARIVERIERDRSILRAEEVAAREHLDLRTLQRLFRAWVGVSPKDVIQRYRIHEALDRVALEGGAKLAAELGYTDQAHFAKHFKKLVGRTPTEHARATRS